MCFSPYLGVWRERGGGLRSGLGHNLLMQFSTLCSSKMEISKTGFFDILTIHNGQISCVKHVIHPLYVFFTLFGCLDGGKGQGHNLFVQFSTLGSPKMEFSETDFLDILTIHNDQISYVKQVLDPLYVFFTLFGCWRGAEASPKGLGHNLLTQYSTLCSSKIEIFKTVFVCYSDHSQ